MTCTTEKRATAPELSRRYNLPVTTLYEWRKKVKKGTKFRETAGHPTLLDSRAKSDLVDELTAFSHGANCRLKENFAPLVNIKALLEYLQ